MSDTKVKKEVKKKNTELKSSNSIKTSNKKVSVKTTKTRTNAKPKTYTKVITETRNSKINKKSRICTIALITTLSVMFLFFLFNKTFFRGEYKVKNIAIDIPYFMMFSSDEDGILTLKTWRNYDYIKSYFDEYLENLDDFAFYSCADGRVLYYDEQKELAIYDIDIKRNLILKTITIDYKIIKSDKVCD